MAQDNGNQEQENNQEPGVDTSQLTVEDQYGQEVENQETSNEQETNLPEGIESWEQLLDRYNDLVNGSSSQGSDNDSSDNEEQESEDSNSGEESGEDDNGETNANEQESQEEETEEQRELRDLKIQLHDREIYDQVGGKEQYEQMKSWAAENMEAEEAEAFNRVFESTDLSAKKVAAKALQAMYREANGVEGESVRGGSPSGLSPIKTDGELMEAMQDPRYRRKDSIGEAYRAEIDKRLAAGMGNQGNNENADGWVTIG